MNLLPVVKNWLFNLLIVFMVATVQPDGYPQFVDVDYHQLRIDASTASVPSWKHEAETEAESDSEDSGWDSDSC